MKFSTMDDEKLSKDISDRSPPARPHQHAQQPTAPMQLGLWQLWRSLPRPCKLFLAVCLVQSIVSGAFASVELSRVRFGPTVLAHPCPPPIPGAHQHFCHSFLFRRALVTFKTSWSSSSPPYTSLA